MAKKEFCRGINNEGVLRKAKNFFEAPIGKALINSKYQKAQAFQTCIRENYFNIYWNGCSVLKYSPNAHKNIYKIHKKYVLQGNDEEKVDYLTLCSALTYNNWEFTKEIVENGRKGNIPLVSKYVVGEKKDLRDYLSQEKPFLLDLEVAFTRKRTQEEKKDAKRDYVADRIDMATIVMESGKPVLRLIEVKRAQDSRLRSENTPEIMHQMERYKTFLDNEKGNIEESYRTVANNLIYLGVAKQMQGLNGQPAEEVLKEFASSPTIDSEPHLLVIGGKDDLNGNIDHWQKLEGLFEEQNYPAPVIWSSM